MAERYTRVFSLQKDLYLEGCPVFIEDGALLKDNEKNRILAQIKFRSIAPIVIMAIKVKLTMFDPAGTELGEKEFQYLDLNVKRNQDFGSKVPVILSHPAARRYSVCVTEVVSATGEVWTAPAGAQWAPMPKAKSMQEMGDGEFARQFALTYKNVSKVWPEEFADLWRCACGCLNRKAEEICHSCRNVQSEILAADADKIAAARDQRLKEEKERRERQAAMEAHARAEEAARKRAQKKRRAKLARRICLPPLAVILLAAICLTSLHFYGMNKAEAYLQEGKFQAARQAIILRFSAARVDPSLLSYLDAGSAMEREEYDAAAEGFGRLYSYRDSMELQKKSIYLNAYKKMEQGDYEAAEDLFLSIGDYQDAGALALECSYLPAMNLLESKRYNEARKLFEMLAQQNYKDSADMVNECWYRKGVEYEKDGKYAQAEEMLEIPAKAGYKDALELACSCLTAQMEKHLNNKSYLAAVNQLEKLIAYGDQGAAQKLLQVRLEGAAYYLSVKNYDDAISMVALAAETNAEAKELHQNARYQKAQSLVSQEKSASSALMLLQALEKEGYAPAKGSYAKAQASYYKAAQQKYAAGNYTSAANLFYGLGSYSKAPQYSILCQMHQNAELNLAELEKVCGMEDANQMLLGHYYEQFLEARWENGNWHFEFYFKDGSLWSSKNLPLKYDGDYYAFKDGIYYEYDSGSSNRYQHKNFTFTIVNWDTIKVYCHQNGTTYTLYRQ